MTQHVNDQNWIAICIDFFIVVLGVFIGLQASVFKENRDNAKAYRLAQNRLVAESQANHVAVQKFIQTNDNYLALVREAIDALEQCSGEVQTAKIDTGLNIIRGTQTLRLRLGALSAMTHDDLLLSRQKESERERLNELFRRLEQAQNTLNWLETWPHERPVEFNIQVGYDQLKEVQADIPFMNRALKLDVPAAQICQDKSLAKHFYLWERVATFQIVRARQVEQWVAENLEIMQAR